METNVMPQGRGNIRMAQTGALNTEHVLPEVRWVAAPVALILLAAWAVLYLQPNRTGELFAWEITPQMSAMFMGAAYGAGTYFFIRVFTAQRWHHVANYFPGIALFAWLMGIATLIHWNAFTGEPFSLECLLEPMEFKGAPISVYTWVILYAVTPFLVPLLWLRNRTKDTAVPDPGDQVVSTRVRWAGALAGAILLLGGLFLFLFPDIAIPVWPWRLTPLMARIVGAFLTAPGVSLLLCARDNRWSAWRVIVQQQAIAVSLVLLALFLLVGTSNNPQPTNPLTWTLAGSLALFLLGLLALLFKMDAPRFTKATQNWKDVG